MVWSRSFSKQTSRVEISLILQLEKGKIHVKDKTCSDEIHLAHSIHETKTNRMRLHIGLCAHSLALGNLCLPNNRVLTKQKYYSFYCILSLSTGVLSLPTYFFNVNMFIVYFIKLSSEHELWI